MINHYLSKILKLRLYGEETLPHLVYRDQKSLTDHRGLKGIEILDLWSCFREDTQQADQL